MKIYLYMGRKKEIIKRGSEIVSPQDIENTCRKFNQVNECAVITKDDINKGSKIYLLVEFKENKTTIKSSKLLRKFLEKNLKKIEFPDKLLIVPKIFRTPSGKLKTEDIQKMNILKKKNIFFISINGKKVHQKNFFLENHLLIKKNFFMLSQIKMILKKQFYLPKSD